MRNFSIATIIILAVVFRFFQLGNLPPSPYWEEVALGYDAYSILQTGRDHHGHWFPIVAFESFGDWKPGFYIYSVIPSIFIFGLNTFAVRLPSAIAGIAIVIGSGVLANLLFLTKKTADQPVEQTDRWLPLLVMLVAAVEPWGIIFSRGAWEANLASALILWAIICIFQQAKFNQKSKMAGNLFFSAILTALAMYTYHAARIAAPLMVGAAFIFQELENKTIWINAKQRAKRWRQLVVPIIVFILMLSPLITNIFTNQVTNRFVTTSIFSNLEIIIQSNQLKEIAGNNLLARLFYHRYLLFAKEISINFVKNFDLGYLFLHGDTNPRHSIQYFGQFFPLSLILIIIGMTVLFFKHRSKTLLFLLWFIVGLLPSTLVIGSPHAVRTLMILPFWFIIIGLGLHRCIDWLSRVNQPKQTIVTLVFSFVLIAQISIFWIYYSQIYPAKYEHEWQFGYQQLVSEVNQLATAFPDDQIYITREQGRPAMYYWFFSQTDPRLVQAYEKTAYKDQGEFLQFGRLHFIDKADQVSTSFGILAASPSFTADVGLATDGDNVTIVDSFGKPIWVVQHYEK